MYEFKTEPYDHQRDAWKDSWAKQMYFLAMEMGTGKSKVAIDSIGALYEANKIDTVLIIAPKGVYDNWIQQEIPRHLPDRIPTKVVRWQANWTEKFKNEISAVALPKNRKTKFLGFLVMNVEALSTQKGQSTALRFLDLNKNNMVIVDESTTIKNRKSARTKAIVACGRAAKYRRVLTGSPITKSPLDLFSQCDFLAPKALGYDNFFAFQARYAVMQKRPRPGGGHYPHLMGYRRLDELGDKLDQFTCRVLKEDCLDLPEKIYTRRNVPLTDEQTKAYRQMKDLALVYLDNGEVATTASILTQIMRLQQITCGFIKADDASVTTPLKNNRLSQLMEVVEEMSGKALIWATYTHDIYAIKEALAAVYGEDSVATYHGPTEQEDRQKIVTEFQKIDSPLRFFIGHPKTGGYGITLTAANTVIYYNNSYDLESRLQSEDRAHRIGQKKSVTYIDLISPNTIDEKILEALKNKINLAQTVLQEDFRAWLV
jgi:SNF2 family DNA or RNA helicase